MQFANIFARPIGYAVSSLVANFFLLLSRPQAVCSCLAFWPLHFADTAWKTSELKANIVSSLHLHIDMNEKRCTASALPPTHTHNAANIIGPLNQLAGKVTQFVCKSNMLPISKRQTRPSIRMQIIISRHGPIRILARGGLQGNLTCSWSASTRGLRHFPGQAIAKEVPRLEAYINLQWQSATCTVLISHGPHQMHYVHQIASCKLWYDPIQRRPQSVMQSSNREPPATSLEMRLNRQFFLPSGCPDTGCGAKQPLRQQRWYPFLHWDPCAAWSDLPKF